MAEIPNDVIEMIIGVDPGGDGEEPSFSVMSASDDDWLEDDTDERYGDGSPDWESLCKQLLIAIDAPDASIDMSFDEAQSVVDELTEDVLFADDEGDFDPFEDIDEFALEDAEEEAVIEEEDDLFAEEDEDV